MEEQPLLNDLNYYWHKDPGSLTLNGKWTHLSGCAGMSTSRIGNSLEGGVQKA